MEFELNPMCESETRRSNDVYVRSHSWRVRPSVRQLLIPHFQPTVDGSTLNHLDRAVTHNALHDACRGGGGGGLAELSSSTCFDVRR